MQMQFFCCCVNDVLLGQKYDSQWNDFTNKVQLFYLNVCLKVISYCVELGLKLQQYT